MDLGARLRAALETSLPGLNEQLRLAPRPRVGWNPHRIPDGLRVAAALVLLYPHGGSLHLPLTVRGGSMRTHTGQVSLPGGAVDPGESLEAAALREAAEEVGIDPASVDVVGRLTSLHIPVSGFLLHPVVGITATRPAFQPAAWEVARLLEVPLAHLQDPGRLRMEPRERLVDGVVTAMDVPYFEVEGEKVWGATAMVLAELLAVTRLAGVSRVSICS